MKYSELNISKLDDNDIYDLVMTGVRDYTKENPNVQNNPDFIIVLGCSPKPLKARVVKMMELFKKGFGKNVLFSGGMGWNKLFKQDPNKTFRSEEERIKDSKMKAKKSHDMNKALMDTVPDEVKKGSFHDKKSYHRPTISYHRIHGNLTRLKKEPEAQIGYKIMKAAKEVIGLDESHVFFEQDSANTIQNLEYSKKLLDELQENGKVDKVNKIMIITSSFHCRRAELSFKKYFPNVEVTSCPATMDIKNAGLHFCKEDLMNSPYYMQQFRNELSAIINYTKNGSIADMNIEAVLDKKRAKEIEKKIYDKNEHEH